MPDLHDPWLPDCGERSVVVFPHGYAEHLGLLDTPTRRPIAGSRGFLPWTPWAADAATVSAP